ncbi:MAG: radical SAM protein [Bacteroidales bacterium]|nr:radical SAM protein [Bacteroidales bacterium]
MKNWANIISFSNSITIKKLFNLFKVESSYYLSVLLKKPIVWGKPYSISIEPASFCNLACEFCPAGKKSLSRPSGVIKTIDFCTIINQVYPELLNLFLYFQGEPFLNKDIFEIIGISKKSGIYTVLSTNGHFLDRENIRKLIESKVDKLIISLDGTEEETYKMYRKNGDFFKVTSGIEQLSKFRKESGASLPFIELQFLVFSHNQQQIEDIKKLGQYLGADKVSLKTAQIYNYEENRSFIPSIKKFSRYKEDNNGNIQPKSVKRNTCPRLWNSTVITWNGNVVPCCFDKNADFVMGNMLIDNFEEIWNNTQYQNFRKQLLTNRKTLEMCRNCL